jgi:hypothetical protein
VAKATHKLASVGGRCCDWRMKTAMKAMKTARGTIGAIVFFSLTFLVSRDALTCVRSDESGQRFSHGRSSLEEYVVIGELSPLSLYNDYTEARYHEVLNRFIAIMKPKVEARGGVLRIKRDWSDGAVNAWAWREGNRYWIEAPGGAARYYLINEEGFLATLCHEMGHLLGGAPGRHEISFEGQSDYYSAAKCLRMVLAEIEPFKVIRPPAEVINSCAVWVGHEQRMICERTMIGALSVTAYYAQLDKVPAPQISTPSQERVRQTLRVHPKAQCRLDTYMAGALCPVSQTEDFEHDDPRAGACHSTRFAPHARPGCWFSEN